jgi:hypothetical protein
MTIYRVDAGQDIRDHKTEAAAIRHAEKLLDSHESHDVRVVMIEKSGSYRSTTQIWPETGPTVTN